MGAGLSTNLWISGKPVNSCNNSYNTASHDEALCLHILETAMRHLCVMRCCDGADRYGVNGTGRRRASYGRCSPGALHVAAHTLTQYVELLLLSDPMNVDTAR